MGEFLDKVNARYEAPEAVAHRVALFLSSTDKRAVIVEAGDDVHFYCTLLRRLESDRPVEFFRGYGRPKVLKALEMLSDLGKIDQSFAIVDRDLNTEDPHMLHSGHCLVLDVYSYENYFENVELLVDVGKVFFSLDHGTSPLIRWSAIVQRFLETLPGSLRLEHAVALQCRLQGLNCNLGCFRVTVHLQLDAQGTVKREPNTTEHFLREVRVDKTQISAIDTKSCEDVLASRPWQATFRGHFFWTMFVKLLNQFRLSLDRELASSKQNRSRTRSELTERHAMEAATSLLPFPPFLRDFLSSVVAS